MSRTSDNITASDQSLIDSVVGVTGCAPDNAWRLLRKHNKNVDNAVGAFFDGDAGDDEPPPLLREPVNWNDITPALSNLEEEQRKSRAGAPTPVKEIIDLTDGDDELTQALQASMQTESANPQVSTTFGPSNRAPDPAWAMVPSNTETPTFSHEEHSLNQAIAASMQTSHQAFAEEGLTQPPEEWLIRKDERPLVFRTAKPGLIYASLALHALYFIPQVRDALAHWMAEGYENGLSSDEDRSVQGVLRALTYARFSALHVLEIDHYLDWILPRPAKGPDEPVGDLTSEFLQKLSVDIESVLKRQVQPHYRANRYGTFEHLFIHPVVRVTAGPTGSSAGDPHDENNLLSALVHALGPQTRLSAPKEAVFIQLNTPPPAYETNASSARQRKKFSYPAKMYIDPFLRESEEVMMERTVRRSQLVELVEGLEKRKTDITAFEGRDNVGELRAAVHYFENIADARGSTFRQAAVERTATQLKDTLTKVESELSHIDTEVRKMKAEIEHAFDIPELQQYPYDLRAVLFHDGQFGRNHFYSYVHQGEKWWKIEDFVVTEVPEEAALTDATGLHLGAGPYMLMYSRTMSPEDIAELDEQRHWSMTSEDAIQDSETFLMHIGPEKAAGCFVPYERQPVHRPVPTRVISPGVLNAHHQASMELL